MTETGPDESDKPTVDRPTLREIAREEFWIVAKSYFAPIYGTLLVWRHLLRVTQRLDRKALNDAEKPLLSAAE